MNHVQSRRATDFFNGLLGVEGLRETFSLQDANIMRGGETLVPTQGKSRSIKAAFGEVVIPLVGAGNSMAGVESLIISASGRYDDYDAIGGTFNPKFGITYMPTDSINLWGNYGTSFNAPSLADTIGQSEILLLPDGESPGRQFLLLIGAATSLRPQSARTWSVGGNISPPPIPGLTFGASYYNIKFKDQIGSPSEGVSGDLGFTLFPDLFYRFVDTPQNRASLLNDTAGFKGASALTVLFNSGGAPTTIRDFRRANVARVNISGIDFNLDYRRSTGFGSFDFRIAGNAELTRSRQAGIGGVVVHPQGSQFRISTTAGIDFGAFRAQVTHQHQGGYNINPGAANAFQAKVGAFCPPSAPMAQI